MPNTCPPCPSKAGLQLPVLEVDGKCIAQTGSILRYVAQQAGKGGHGVPGAQADAVFEAAQETPMVQIFTAVNLMEEPLAKATAAKFKSHLPQYLKNWTNALQQRPYFHGAPQSQPRYIRQVRDGHVQTCVRLAGSDPGYADFAVFSLLDVGMKFVPSMLESWAALRAWFDRVKNVPAVAEYLAQRPPCRDVSKWVA